MSRLTSWFRSPPEPSAPAIPPSELLAQEMSDITNAFLATELIMDDDMDGAEALLKTGTSCYHHLSLSVISFMRAILGFEKKVMNAASASLNDCETRALADQKKAQRDIPEELCGLYKPGTEYALVLAEAQLMGAVVGVLHESVTEALRSFYKLRKAYFTLEALAAQETQTLKALSEKRAAEKKEQDKTSVETTADGSPFVLEKIATTTLTLDSTPSSAAAPLRSPLHSPFPTDTTFTTPRDVFIHSGINLCFGVLLFLFTMIPPAFSRLLSIVGFRGDRLRGISLLWESTAFANVHGAIAALVLLNYYHGLLGFSDILPTEEHWDAEAATIGYPRARCQKLLKEMKERYPSSGLWRLEEARLCSSRQDLQGALEVLQRTDVPVPKMKQVAALLGFELALNAMFAQDWPLMKKAFLAALELNDWSHAMYYYLAGAAELELYRDAVAAGDVDEARRKQQSVGELIVNVASVSGRKKFLAKQLPIEQYLLRKLARWEERIKAAAAKGIVVELADVIGVSPAYEMTFLSNGLKRMDEKYADKAMGLIDWGRLTAPEGVKEEIMSDADEVGSQALCRATLLRKVGKMEEAKRILETEILSKDRGFFKGPTRDDWIQPAGHYEMAVCYWEEACPEVGLDMDAFSAAETGGGDDKAGQQAMEEFRKEKALACQKHLDIAANWEAYVLDARVGMRVQTGLETMKWFRRKIGI